MRLKTDTNNSVNAPVKIRLILLFIALTALNLKAQPGIGLGGPGIRIAIQKPVVLSSGDIEPLLGVKSLNIKYDYEYMAVCNFTSETDYLEDLKKKRPKKAGALIENWKLLPKSTLEPKFEEFFNMYSDDLKGHTTEIENQATLVVKILREDPDYHAELNDSPPYIVAECTFLDSEGSFIARFNLTAIGSRENTVAASLGQCYAIAGKMLAREVTKRLSQVEIQR